MQNGIKMPIKIERFEMEISKRTNQHVLIAIAEDGTKWVVGGNSQWVSYLAPYDTAFDIAAETGYKSTVA